MIASLSSCIELNRFLTTSILKQDFLMKLGHLITVSKFTRVCCISETAQNSQSTLNRSTKFYMVHCKLNVLYKVLSDHEPVQSMPLKEGSDYSLPKALDISNGDETEGEPVCSTGE